MAASDDPTQTSPKVEAAARGGNIAAAAGGTALLFVLLLASQVTPELLGFLGPWAVPVAFAIGGVVSTIMARKAAWNALDPLRQNYHAQVQAVIDMQSKQYGTGQQDDTPGRHAWQPPTGQQG